MSQIYSGVRKLYNKK